MSHAAPAWPDKLLDAVAVRAWIAGALPGQPDVSGPTTVYKRRGWGVTARFAVAGGADVPPEVVFKATHLARFAHAPRLYALLARVVPAHVPDLLAWRPTDDGGWMLFRPFAGPTLEEIGGVEPLAELGRTLARIQVALAGVPSNETAFVPRVPVGSVPAMLDDLLPVVRERYVPVWASGGDQNPHAAPPDLPTRLARFRPHLIAWADELAAGPWPSSLDHVDLHDANAVLEPDGRIVIFDWDEAVWSCPFFSIECALDVAWSRGRADGATLWERPAANGGLPTAPELAVRDAYLDAIPWGTPPERRRAVDLALCLEPLKFAWETQAYADALGWTDGLPDAVGHYLVRALRRWGRTTGRPRTG